jgi:hypothetical protein
MRMPEMGELMQFGDGGCCTAVRHAQDIIHFTNWRGTFVFHVREWPAFVEDCQRADNGRKAENEDYHKQMLAGWEEPVYSSM